MREDIIAALLTAVPTLVGVLVGGFVTLRVMHSQRSELLWSKELDRFLALEELAGELVEEIGNYRPIPDEGATPSFTMKFKALEGAAGRFRRYPQVCQAIRDLHNTVGRLYDSKKHRDDDERAIRGELGPAFQMLLSACDGVIGRTRMP